MNCAAGPRIKGKLLKLRKITNDVTDSQYEISLKHFTGYFILIDKDIIRRLENKISRS